MQMQLFIGKFRGKQNKAFRRVKFRKYIAMGSNTVVLIITAIDYLPYVVTRMLSLGSRALWKSANSELQSINLRTEEMILVWVAVAADLRFQSF